MYYSLLKNNILIGLFNSEKNISLFLKGLENNNLIKKDSYSSEKYYPNTILKNNGKDQITNEENYNCKYLYALIKKEKLIGIFDNIDKVRSFTIGLINNNLLIINEVEIQEYTKNTTFKNRLIDLNETQYKINEINEFLVEINNLKSVNSEIINRNINKNKFKNNKNIDKKLNKKKKELNNKIFKLEKKRDEIKQLKTQYNSDLELYKKFKKMKKKNDFTIPKLFKKKYLIFKQLDEDNKISLNNFYSNYKKNNINTTYNRLFK